MATDDVQFRIRLSSQLKSRLENIAAEEGRSLNAEIARRLESSLDSFHYTKREEWLDQLSGLNEAVLQIDHQLNRLSKVLASIFEDADLLRPLIITKMASLQRDRERICGEVDHIQLKIRNGR